MGVTSFVFLEGIPGDTSLGLLPGAGELSAEEEDEEGLCWWWPVVPGTNIRAVTVLCCF